MIKIDKKEIIPKIVDKKKFVVICLSCFVLGLVSGYFFCANTGISNVSNNGSGADAVRNELSNAREHNQNAIERVEAVEGERNRSETAVANSIDRLTENEARITIIEKGIGELDASNRECQSIIKKVRARNETKD